MINKYNRRDRAPKTGRKVGLALLVGASLLVIGQPQIPRAQAVTGVPLPVEGVYFGSYVKVMNGEMSRQESVLSTEQAIGRRFAIDHQYFKWDSAFPTSYEAWTADQGRIPFLNWTAKRSNGVAVTWGSIASGSQDSWIAARADALKSFGYPVYLSFHAEPESDVSRFGSSGDFAAAWRHIVDVFRNRGVTNVSFVWTLMAWSFTEGSAAAFYPGDSYVDVIASDGYNWYPGRVGSRWRSFAEIMRATHDFAVTHGKPLMAAEYGVQEDPANPGRKGQWFLDVLATAKAWPDLIGVVYFDSDTIYPWMPDTSASSLAGYIGLAADPYMGSMLATPAPSSNGSTNTSVSPTPSPSLSPSTSVSPTPTPTPSASTSVSPTPTPSTGSSVSRANSFSGGSAGAVLSAAGSGGISGDGFDAVVIDGASSLVFDQSHAVGTMAVRHVVGPGGNAFYAWDVGLQPAQVLYGRVYVWFDSLPASGTCARIIRGTTTTSLRFAVDLVSAGKLRVIDSRGGKVVFTKGSIATGRWVRIEWRVDFGADTLKLRLYNDASSPVPSEEVSAAGPFGAWADQVQFGRSGSQAPGITFWTDEPAMSTSGFPAPAV